MEMTDVKTICKELTQSTQINRKKKTEHNKIPIESKQTILQ